MRSAFACVRSTFVCVVPQGGRLLCVYACVFVIVVVNGGFRISIVIISATRIAIGIFHAICFLL